MITSFHEKLQEAIALATSICYLPDKSVRPCSSCFGTDVSDKLWAYTYGLVYQSLVNINPEAEERQLDEDIQLFKEIQQDLCSFHSNT